MLFQHYQKFAIFSEDKTKVLLARRKSKADYDSVYSFIGGKMETSDESMLAGMKREKDEEIGSAVAINILPNESYNMLYRKNDGNCMILPHLAGLYISGEILLNDEYSDYIWVPVDKIDAFEPKITSIPEATRWALRKLAISDQKFTVI